MPANGTSAAFDCLLILTRSSFIHKNYSSDKFNSGRQCRQSAVPVVGPRMFKFYFSKIDSLFRLNIRLFQVARGWSYHYFSIARKPAAMAGAIPGVLHMVPVYQAAKVRANG